MPAETSMIATAPMEVALIVLAVAGLVFAGATIKSRLQDPRKGWGGAAFNAVALVVMGSIALGLIVGAGFAFKCGADDYRQWKRDAPEREMKARVKECTDRGLHFIGTIGDQTECRP